VDRRRRAAARGIVATVVTAVIVTGKAKAKLAESGVGNHDAGKAKQ